MISVDEQSGANRSLWIAIIRILEAIRAFAGKPNTLNYKSMSIEIEVKFHG